MISPHARRAMRSSLLALLQNSFCRASSTYRTVERADVHTFERICGPQNVIHDEDELLAAGTDWLRQRVMSPALLIRPGSPEEVAAVISYCYERRIAVVPQGGNTGLVGGSVPALGCEVALSLSRLNRILGFDEDSGIVTAEAGVILASLDEYLASKGYAVPLDLGSKGSCQIGGNVSTAAAGLRYVRYGSLKGSVTGLSVVTGTGTALDMLSRLRKDAVGYDLKQMFIGSEGTLGVVTAVCLQAVPRPSAPQVALLGLTSWTDVRSAVRSVRGPLGLGESLSAVEFVDGTAMRVAGQVMGRTGPPLALGEGNNAGFFPYYMLLEAGGVDPDHDAAKMSRVVETLLSNGIVKDAILSSSLSQAKSLWKLRETVPIALAQRGWVFKYDVSLSVEEFPLLVNEARARLKAAGIPSHGPDAVHSVGYGHLADGNLHLNVSTSHAQHHVPRLPPAHVQAVLEPWVYEWVLHRGGSISAEHGLGQDKAKWLARARPEPIVSIMRSMKGMLDPRGILNPGKVLPLL